MNKVVRIPLKVMLGLLFLVILLVALLAVKYSPRYVYRLARYNMADVYDYAHFEKRVKIAGEPGMQFQYNNYNTSYLGLIIERATGLAVSEYLEEKLR